MTWVKNLCRLHFRFWTYGPPDFGPNGPKWPKNLFFEMWLVCIVIIYEIEAFFMDITKRIFLELFDHFWPPPLKWPKMVQKPILWDVIGMYCYYIWNWSFLHGNYEKNIFGTFWPFLTPLKWPKMAQKSSSYSGHVNLIIRFAWRGRVIKFSPGSTDFLLDFPGQTFFVYLYL